LGGQKVMKVLWQQVHELFDTDDGSLPEIRLNYADAKAAAKAYELLHARAARVVPEGALIWSNVKQAPQPLESVANPAALVQSGTATPFHVVFSGIQSVGVTLPDLGVFVFPAQMALDYRMGPSWGPSQVEALFHLLVELTRLDGGASLSLEEGLNSGLATRFQQAWRRFQSEHAAQQPR
jgi:hypothetical protein